jgi:hypothetical protein
MQQLDIGVVSAADAAARLQVLERAEQEDAIRRYWVKNQVTAEARSAAMLAANVIEKTGLQNVSQTHIPSSQLL